MNPLWTPSVQQAATSASAMLLTAIGLIAVLQRGQWLITLLFASAFLALGALQAGALGLLRATTTDGAHVWADYLARVSALLSWLWLSLSVLLGRPEPRRQLREAGAPLALSLVACVILFALARSSMVLDSVAVTPQGVVVQLGPLVLRVELLVELFPRAQADVADARIRISVLARQADEIASQI